LRPTGCCMQCTMAVNSFVGNSLFLFPHQGKFIMTTNFTSNCAFVQFYFSVILLLFILRALYQLPLIRHGFPLINSPKLPS
jgi:hypothetical protein